MSATHVYRVGDRATVIDYDYGLDGPRRHVVIAIGVVTHAKRRVRLDTGKAYQRSHRDLGWHGYAGARGRLRPYEPGDEERLEEWRASEALDDAKRLRRQADGSVDRATKAVDAARAHLEAMAAERDQAHEAVATAEARLAEARAKVAALGGAS